MKDIFTKHKTKFIAGLVIVAVLAAAFFWGGSYPKSSTNAAGSIASENITASLPPSTSPETSKEPDAVSASVATKSAPSLNVSETEKPSAPPDTGARSTEEAVNPSPSKATDNTVTGSRTSSGSQRMQINPSTGKDKFKTDPVPAGKPIPIEPQDAKITDKKLTCTLSVRCDTILNNMKLLDEEKWEMVPKDGVIFATATVTFYEGESVLNILQREMKKAKIHMEFANVPMYNSAYIKGINNLYEFDVGELSGWMYKVNSWFPNYGCSRYQLKQGDMVEWVYTCDLGKDIGGSNALGGS